MFYTLRNRIRNFFFWGWKLRDQVPYDSSSIYPLLRVKLEELRDYFKTDKIMQWSEPNTRLTRELAEATELAKRLEEDDYMVTAYREIYGPDEVQDITIFIASLNKADEEDRKYRRKIYKKYGDLQKQHKDRFFYLLKKNIESWWS